MTLVEFFALDYPITHPFPWKWAGLAAYTAAFALTVFVTIVNVALVGYETVSVFTDKYNAQDHHWYHKFVPTYKAHRTCDPVIFSAGDTLFTNSSLFEWKIESVANENSTTSLEYRGDQLEGCALNTLLINAPLNWRRMEITAIARCELPNSIVMDLVSSTIADINDYSYVSYLRNSGSVHSLGRRTTRSFAVQGASYWAAVDVINVYWMRPNFRALAFPIELSTQFDFTFCPPNSKNEACMAEGARLSKSPVFVLLNEASYVLPGNNPAVDNLTSILDPTLENLARMMHDAIRIDFGNNRTNNIFLDSSTINQTLTANFTPIAWDSRLVRFLNDPIANYPAAKGYMGKFPLAPTFGSSTIQATYLCRFQKLKSPGSLFASVFAATSTVITGVWGVAMIIMIWYIKKDHPERNCCEHMASYSKVSVVSS